MTQGWAIDTHIHVIPPCYEEALESMGGDPSGWPTPHWTPSSCIEFMNQIGDGHAILSVTAPGPALLSSNQKACRELARRCNDQVGKMVEQEARFDYFASLPDFNDVQGCVEEIDWLFEQQKLCAGVVIMTSYGERLVGDVAFGPIWQRLNHHRALVFMHPSSVKILPELIGGFLPQPIVDYPQATTRAALSIILSGTLRACPDIDIILSHSGGTLPFLGWRAFRSLNLPAIQKHAGVTSEQAQEDAKRFYYDVATSTSPPQLAALLIYTTPDRLLFGSDYPYALNSTITGGLKAFGAWLTSAANSHHLTVDVMSQNARRLLSRHGTELKMNVEGQAADWCQLVVGSNTSLVN